MTAADPLIFTTPWLAVIVLLIVICGTVVQAGLGMGFGLLVAPIFALIDPALVPGPTLYLGMLTALMGVFREHRAIVWNEIGIGALGRLFGVIIGAAALASVADRKTFMLIFGLVIGLAVLMSALGRKLPFTTRNLLAMSVVSGSMGIITSVGAPPMALLYSQRPASIARPTLAAFFAVGCALSIIGLNLSGWGGWHDILVALFMLPGVIIGTLLAGRLHGRFDKRYQPILLAIAGLAALLLIIRGLV